MADIKELAATVREALQESRDYIEDDDPGDADTAGFHASLMSRLLKADPALDALVAECESEAELHRIELHHANAKRNDAEARARRYEEKIAEIDQLVRHEWRLKDHNPVLVLATIEQVLDAD